MTAQSDPFVRVYYSVMGDDPKFAQVYDDDARFACWVRLLLVADACYPAPAPLPHGIKKAPLSHLVTVGLVDLLPGNRYRIHGLQAEREKRSERASASARKRWADATAMQGTDATAMRPHSDRNAPHMRPNANPNLSEPIRTEPLQSTLEHAPASGDEPDDEVTTLQKLAESLTGTPYGFPRHGGMGEKVGVLLRKHGIAAVEAEWRRIAAEERGMPTVRQLVLGADNALNRISAASSGKRDEVAEFVARVRAEVPGA